MHGQFKLHNRPLDTIVMDPEQKKYIVNDAKEFFESESWYAERGLPFRRGVSIVHIDIASRTSSLCTSTHAIAIRSINSYSSMVLLEPERPRLSMH